METVVLIFLLLLSLIFLIRRKRHPVLSYKELLNTDEWRSKRMEILKRDGFKCQWCGNMNRLHVHHKYYLKYPNNEYVYPWKYNNDAYITLCDECHKRCHVKYPNKVYYIKR